MNILAIDTATEACSAALTINGERSSSYKLAPREHSALILKMIDGLLAEANLAVSQLDAIAFGRGPGSFMGLRIAAGVVQSVEDQWLRDPQLKARHYFETITHEKKGSVVASGLALGLLGTPGKTPHAGRAIGADNHAVFCQLLGMKEAEFQQYLKAGVIQA